MIIFILNYIFICFDRFKLYKLKPIKTHTYFKIFYFLIFNTSRASSGVATSMPNS